MKNVPEGGAVDAMPIMLRSAERRDINSAKGRHIYFAFIIALFLAWRAFIATSDLRADYCLQQKGFIT
jgi:hypothetical protein